MIHVIATVELHDGKRDAFLEEFGKVTPNVHAEAGCLDYVAAIDVDSGIARQIPVRENVVTIVEKWQSLEALQAHLTAAHMSDYRERVKQLVKSVRLQILEPM